MASPRKKTKTGAAGRTYKASSQPASDQADSPPSLRQLRNAAVEGKYSDYFSSPEFQSTPSGSILACFERLLFPSMSCEMDRDSSQYVLMDYLRKNGHSDINRWHKNARRAARGVVFDCAVKLNSIGNSGSSFDLEDAFCRASLITDPLSILDDENVLHYLAYGMASGRTEFLRDLHDDFYNADRRDRILRIDWPIYVMAVHWTNTHCPLWLMERDAILETCKCLSSNGTWTKASVQDRIKKFKLPRGPEWPIVGVLTEPSSSNDDASTKRLISGFEVSRKAFPPLKPMQFQSSFFQKIQLQSVKRNRGQDIEPVQHPRFQILGEQSQCGRDESKPIPASSGYKLVPRSTTRYRVDR